MESKIIVRENITTEELAQRLTSIVKNGNKVTLATDYNWYKPGFVDPESAYVPTGAVCFEEVDFSLLRELLQSEGIYLTVYPGQSRVFLLDTRVYTALQFFKLFQ